MAPPRSLRQSLADGVAVWLASLLFTASLRLTFGGWTLPALPELTADWLATTGAMLAVTAATSFVVVAFLEHGARRTYRRTVTPAAP